MKLGIDEGHPEAIYLLINNTIIILISYGGYSNNKYR